MCWSLRLRNARADATSNAAEELSPAPIGTSPWTRILAPLRVRSLVLKNARDAQNVIAPRSCLLFGQVIDIKFEVAGKFLRVDQKLAVRPLGDGKICRKPESRWHDEPVVVVRMFADQVDASRGAKDRGALAEQFLEMLGEGERVHS